MHARAASIAAVLFLASGAFAQTITPQSATRSLVTKASALNFVLEEFVVVTDNHDWSANGFEDVNQSLSSFAQGLGHGESKGSQHSTFASTAFHADGTTSAAAVQGGLSTDATGEGTSSYSATFNLSAAASLRLAGLVRSFDVKTQGVLPSAFKLEAFVKFYDSTNTLLFDASVVDDNVSNAFDKLLNLPAGQYRLDCQTWTKAGAFTHDPSPDGKAEFFCDMTVVPSPATLAIMPLALAARRRRSLR